GCRDVPPAVPGPLQRAPDGRPGEGPLGRVLPRLRAEAGHLLRLVLRRPARVPADGDRVAVDGGGPELGGPAQLRGDPAGVPQPAPPNAAPGDRPRLRHRRHALGRRPRREPGDLREEPDDRSVRTEVFATPKERPRRARAARPWEG